MLRHGAADDPWLHMRLSKGHVGQDSSKEGLSRVQGLGSEGASEREQDK